MSSVRCEIVYERKRKDEKHFGSKTSSSATLKGATESCAIEYLKDKNDKYDYMIISVKEK